MRIVGWDFRRAPRMHLATFVSRFGEDSRVGAGCKMTVMVSVGSRPAAAKRSWLDQPVLHPAAMRLAEASQVANPMACPKPDRAHIRYALRMPAGGVYVRRYHLISSLQPLLRPHPQ